MINEGVKQKLIEFCHIYNMSTNFQVVARVDGMRFVIHANENCGLNKGHIHIESGDDELEIDLQSFEIINASGKTTPYKRKQAIAFVKNNQQMFIEYWNEFSNGVKIYV
ncbi:MAG: DUF4160 domain-containing protein [Lachnospira sp.]